MKRPKFDAKEALFLHMQIGRSGSPKPFVDALLKKVRANTDMSLGVALASPKSQTKDVRRALVVESLQERFPDMQITEAIEHGRWFTELEQAAVDGEEPWATLLADRSNAEVFRELFPKHGDLRSSVSRGKKTNEEKG